MADLERRFHRYDGGRLPIDGGNLTSADSASLLEELGIPQQGQDKDSRRIGYEVILGEEDLSFVLVVPDNRHRRRRFALSDVAVQPESDADADRRVDFFTLSTARDHTGTDRPAITTVRAENGVLTGISTKFQTSLVPGEDGFNPNLGRTEQEALGVLLTGASHPSASTDAVRRIRERRASLRPEQATDRQEQLVPGQGKAGIPVTGGAVKVLSVK